MSASATKITLKSDKKLKPPPLVNINSTTSDSGLNDDSNDDWWDSPFDFSNEKMNHNNTTDSFSNLRSFWQGRVRASSYPTDSKTQRRQHRISLSKEVNKIKIKMTSYLSYLIAQLQKLSKSIVMNLFFN